MPDLTAAATDALWNALQEHQAAGSPVRSSWEHPLLTLAQTIARLRKMLAVEWKGQNAVPESRDALAQVLEQSAMAKWHQPLVMMEQCIEALELMAEEDFRWIPMQEARPVDGQAVLYYFEIVGTHPGFYEDGRLEGVCRDMFTGLFGGFLGDDVTHWMPMPGQPLPQAAQHAA